MGLDVTLQCVLGDAQAGQFRAAPRPHAQFLGQLLDLWNHAVILHDPLTVLTLVDECVTFAPKRVEIGLCGAARGKTLVVDGPPNCRVAASVDAARAKALFLKRVLA